MITDLHLENYRGIAAADIHIAPLTILAGANNSGKSSLMYALLTLKNIISNPNQPLDSFLNFVFINLGGFKETVHLKEEASRKITLEIRSAGTGFATKYGVALGKSQSTLFVHALSPSSFGLKLDVTFPYALNLTTGITVEDAPTPVNITWNGISPTVTLEKTEPPDEETPRLISTALLAPIDDLKRLDFVPLKRGFVKPIFSAVPLQPQLISEDEIATFIANDRDLEASVNFYLEKVVNKNFYARPLLGTANFYLQTVDRTSGFLSDLVNDGFGTNQLVYLLAKALRQDQTTICIEEPEIHLHPGALSRLIQVLAEIAKDRKKNFLISSHSEHLVLSLLGKVARKLVAADDVRVYYVRKEKAQTLVEEQQVNEKGQIEGGLRAFYDAELEQMREFLGLEEAE